MMPFFELFTKEPVIVVLAVAEQDVEIVIAKDTLCMPSFDQTLNEIDNRWTIGSTVGQIAYKNQSSAIGMYSIAAVTEMFEQ